MTITADQLFDQVVKAIAYPHTTITKHEKKQALEIFRHIDDFFVDVDNIKLCDIKNTIDKIEMDFYFEDHPEERNYVKDWEAIRV